MINQSDNSEENPFIYAPQKEAVKGGIIVDIMQTIVIALAICVFIYIFLAIPNQVDGSSMEPNFQNAELLFTNKIIQIIGDNSIGKKLNYDYQRGDVIVFQLPNNPDFIKRIIAGPGDTVMIADNHPIVNGKIIYESYIPSTTMTIGGTFLEEGEEKTVPDGYYFVMGDNREASKDSRSEGVGFVNRKYIKGKVFFRWWPFNQIGLIGKGGYEERDYPETDNTDSETETESTLKLEPKSNKLSLNTNYDTSFC